MAGRDQNQKKGGSSFVGNLLFGAVIIAVLVALVVQFMKPSDHPIKSKQGTPEGAVQAYLEAAWNFKSGNPNFDHIKEAVREQDYQWFQDNYMTIFSESSANQIVGFTSAADPSTVGHAARQTVMSDLLSIGPHRLDSEIVTSNVSGNDAEMILRKKEVYSNDYTEYTDVKVRVTREGKRWKVVDFAGGRAMLEGRTRPDDFRVLSANEVAGIEAGARAAAGAAGAAPPPSPDDIPGGIPPEGFLPGAPPPAQPGAMNPEQQIDQLIAQASQYWRAQDYQRSLGAAQQALQICHQQLGPQHPKTQQVQQMVAAAQQQLQPRF